MRHLFLFFLLSAFSLFSKEVIPVAVIGSGPAGMGAALVLGRERIETHLFVGNKAGGPLNARTCLSNWPGSIPGKGDVVMERLFQQLSSYDVQLHPSEVVAVDFSSRPFSLKTEQGEEILAEYVIVATGALPRQLGVPGEEIWEIESYVYKTDVEKFTGKQIVVVGGGIDAMKKAKIAAKKAASVTVLVRGKSMQHSFMEKQLLKHQNVKISYETKVFSLEGEQVLVESPLGKRAIDADHLIVAAGIVPNTALVKGQLLLEESGCIALQGRTQKTSVEGVFAAGTVTDPFYRQAAISAGDGMKAAYNVLECTDISLHLPLNSASQ